MTTATPEWTLQPPVSTRTLVTATIPVDLPSTTYRMLYRQVMGPVNPGDKLDVSGEARVTNDCGYTIGVGWYLYLYDYSDPLRDKGPRTMISPLRGDNVDVPRHHMPLAIRTLYTMPDDWPPGHRPAVFLAADAHSTAWQAGDTLTVDDGYGELIIQRWAIAPS